MMEEAQLSSDMPLSHPVGLGSNLLRHVVMGYNHKVPHAGRIYHIQTEDSGRNRHRIFTHVFYHGTIIASKRVTYDGLARTHDIASLLKNSHKSMMRQLVHGCLDEAIARCLGGDDADRHAANDAEAAPSFDPEQVDDMLKGLMSEVTGTIAIALIDAEDGQCLATQGVIRNLAAAATGSIDMMNANATLMRALGVEGEPEDIVTHTTEQCHILRSIGSGLFLYMVLDRREGNLAIARHRLLAAQAAQDSLVAMVRA